MRSTLRSKINPKVWKLLRKLKIDLLSKEQYEAVTGSLFSGGDGAYHPASDSVMVDYENCYWDNHSEEINSLILHEIIHWTGAGSRTCRDIIVFCKLGVDPDMRSRHTEEAVAQIGMVLLGAELGFDFSCYLDTYLWLYPEADMEFAKKEAKKAVEYVLQQTT